MAWSVIVFVSTFSSKEGGGDGAMNLETGVFTSLTSGHYTLTLSGYSALDARVDNYLDLYHNGHMVTHHNLVRCRIFTMSMSDYLNVITNMREFNTVKVWQLGYYWRQYHTGDLPSTVGVMASRTLVKQPSPHTKVQSTLVKQPSPQTQVPSTMYQVPKYQAPW